MSTINGFNNNIPNRPNTIKNNNNNIPTTGNNMMKVPPTIASCLFGPTCVQPYIRPSVGYIGDEDAVSPKLGTTDRKTTTTTTDESQQPTQPPKPNATPPSTPLKPAIPTRPSKKNTTTTPTTNTPTTPSPTPSPHIINLQELRRLTAQGIPEDSSHRPLAWRILLQYLPLDTSQWQHTLDRDRTLYRNLVEELFIFPPEEPFNREGGVLRGMGWKRREQTTRKSRRVRAQSREVAREERRRVRSVSRGREGGGGARGRSVGRGGGDEILENVVITTTTTTTGMDERPRHNPVESTDGQQRQSPPAYPWTTETTPPQTNNNSSTRTSIRAAPPSTTEIERGVEVLTVQTSDSKSFDTDNQRNIRPIASITTDEERRVHLDKAISAVTSPSSTDRGSLDDDHMYPSRSMDGEGCSTFGDSGSFEGDEEWEKLARKIPDTIKEQWKSSGRDVASLFAGLGAKRNGKRPGSGGRFLNALLIEYDGEMVEGGGDVGGFDGRGRGDGRVKSCSNGLGMSQEDMASSSLSQQQEPEPTQKQPQEKSENDLDARWTRIFENASLLDEIRKDVVRTHPDLRFFLEEQDNIGQRRYAALERILFVWAKLNKGVRYVQGMNEIVGTMYFVLANDTNEEWAREAEADTYFLFNTLMVEMRDIFVPDLDDADTGIQGRMSHMIALLSLHDPEVRCHLDDCGIDPAFYSIRWLTTLLSREFYLPDTIRLWDSMFASTHKDNFMRYVCVSMVMIIREGLLKGDFGTCLRLLQKYPPTNIDQLLEASRALWIYESQVTLACHKGGISLTQALTTIAPPPAVVMAYGLSGGMAVDEVERMRKNSKRQQRQRRRSPAPKNVPSPRAPMRRRGSFGSIGSVGSKSLFAGFFGIGTGRKKNSKR